MKEQHKHAIARLDSPGKKNCAFSVIIALFFIPKYEIIASYSALVQKLNVVSKLETDPPCANSDTRQNPPTCRNFLTYHENLELFFFVLLSVLKIPHTGDTESLNVFR